MSKYDDLKALAKQKIIDALPNREQPTNLLRLSDDYGTSANPTAIDAGIRRALDADTAGVEGYWEARKKGAREAAAEQRREANRPSGMKKGGKVSSASKRADGIAQRGKTKGRIV